VEKNKLQARIFLLAKETNKELSEDLVQIYIKLSETFGQDLLIKVFEEFIQNRNAKDPFPTPFEIKAKAEQLMGQTEDLPEEIAGRIVRAISRCGYTNPQDAKKLIGDVGWKIVETYGGWKSLCEGMTIDQTTIYTAQFRNLAEKLLERNRFIGNKALPSHQKFISQ